MTIKGCVLAVGPSTLHSLRHRIESSPIGYRLAKGVFWSICGTVISRGLGFVASILVARLLGKVGFGEFGIIQSTVGMFGVFAGFGLGVTATRYVAEYRDKDPDKAGRIIALSGLTATLTAGCMCLALIFAAPWLAERTLNAPHLAGMLRIGTLFLFLQALNGAQTGALAGFEAFKAIAYINFYAGLTAFPLMTGGAYFGGVNGAIWGLVGSTFINWAMNHLALRSECAKFHIHMFAAPGWEEFLILWRYSVPVVFAGMLTTPAVWLCNSFMVNSTNGYAHMGAFNAANVPQTAILMLTSTLQLPLLTAFSNINPENNGRLGRLNILSSWAIGSFPVLVLVSFPEVIQMLFGRDYAGPEFCRTVVIVSLFTSIIVYKQGLTRVLFIRELVWWGALSNAVWASVLVCCAFFMTRWGAIGLALAFLTAYALNTIVFVPLYTMRGLAPRSTILSWEAMVIWIVLGAASALSFAAVPVPFRIAAFMAGLAGITLAFVRLMNPGTAARAGVAA
jgi:O-antigen/teichoic acid export membrane protein